MADWSHDNKTEVATPRRREDARKKGQVAVSPDLTGALTLLAAALGLWLAGASLGGRLCDVFSEVLPNLSGEELGPAETMVWGRWFLGRFLQLTAVVMGGLVAIGTLASAVQAGFQVSTEPLSPNWSRLSPVEGWSKVFSLDGLVRGVMSLLKLTAAAAIGVSVTWSRWSDIQVATHGRLNGSIAVTWQGALAIILSLSAAALVLAALDFLFRRYRHEQKLRMSRQEVKDEQKEDQGDPQNRARIRTLQRQAATRKSLKNVPKASLVITNPTHIAVALQYRAGQAGAPTVVAKGKGAVALRIMQIAREHGIPVQERKPLARALYKLVEVGQEIPLELYHAVAEILALVYRRKHAA
jgi:flagellar biosynthetic protein FlhB